MTTCKDWQVLEEKREEVRPKCVSVGDGIPQTGTMMGAQWFYSAAPEWPSSGPRAWSLTGCEQGWAENNPERTEWPERAGQDSRAEWCSLVGERRQPWTSGSRKQRCPRGQTVKVKKEKNWESKARPEGSATVTGSQPGARMALESEPWWSRTCTFIILFSHPHSSDAEGLKRSNAKVRDLETENLTWVPALLLSDIPP